jgi:hypothetical protein
VERVEVRAPILTDVPWVSFDFSTVVIEAVAHNPRIAAVNHQASISLERILQEDAVFDPAVLLESKYGSTSDPVGNSLTTGGPPRACMKIRGTIKQVHHQEHTKRYEHRPVATSRLLEQQQLVFCSQ